MDSLRSIDEVQLNRLLRRDAGERLFLATPSTGNPSGATELVHLFTLPPDRDPGVTEAQDLAPARIYEGIPPTGLPRLLGMGLKDPSSLYVICEDPEGTTLEQVLAMNPDWARRSGPAWLAGLCRVLARLHASELACARAVPRHLLVARDGGAILADPLTIPLLHQIHGGISFEDPAFLRLHPDPGAAPPELVAEGTAIPAGDVFQAGVLGYRFLTGRPAFGEGSTLEIFNRSRSGRVEMPASGGPLAEAVVASLAPSPGDRPSAVELAAALESDSAEPLPMCDVEPSRYSASFPPMGEHDDAGPDEPRCIDKNQAIAQLDAMLGQAAAERRSSHRRILSWYAALAVLIVLGGLLAYSSAMGPPPSPSSRVETEEGGRTHAPAAQKGGPRGSQGSLHMENLPEKIRTRIEGLGFPTRDVPMTTHRGGARCEVLTEGADGLLHRFVFPRCRTLSRMCTLDIDARCTPRPDGTLEFRVLYDPHGNPQLLQALGKDDEVLRNIEFK